MLFALALLLIGSLIGAGVIVRQHRWLSYVASAAALVQGQWLALTLLDRTLLASVASASVFTIGSLILALAWLVHIKLFQAPPRSRAQLRRDVAVALVTLVVLAASWIVVSRNGYQEDTSWLTHGFYNGDTTTLISLVQRSLMTEELVAANPFAAGGALEYPTLVHGGIATALVAAGLDASWLTLLPLLTLLQVAITVPLLFLFWDAVSPEPTNGQGTWLGLKSRPAATTLQAGVVLYVLALSWDGFIYPQSHFFITGLLVLQTALWVVTLGERDRRQYVPGVTALMLTLVLLLSNAVMGTAALAIAVVAGLIRANDKGRLVLERASYLALVPLLAIAFFWLAPGEPSFGGFGFSYTAAPDMLRLAPVLALLAVGIFWSLSRQTFVAAGAVVLLLMAWFTFIFSARDIVVANASRFFYHAVLVGFPMLTFPLVRAYYLVRRELLFTTHKLVELGAGWGLTVAVLALLAAPALASVASAHDNLMYQDEQRVDAAALAAMDWIRENTEPNAIFLAGPDAPWIIPLFTGRSLLRTNYWLSPEDDVTADVDAAFAGDLAARELAVPQADFLVLTADERLSWEPLPLEAVFDNDAIVIYRIP